MSIAEPPIDIRKPIAIGTSETIRVEVYADSPPRTPQSLSGKAVTVLILNPGVTAVSAAKSYTVTATSSSLGQGTITLTGGSHTTTGIANAHLYVDGMLRGRYRWEFVAKYT